MTTSVYLKIPNRMWVGNPKNPEKKFGKRYFEAAVMIISASHQRTLLDRNSVRQDMRYDHDYFVYRIKSKNKNLDNIKVEDIHGLYFSTIRGTVKYVKNPLFRKQ